MSERVNVMVEFPLARMPSKPEYDAMLKESYGKAQELIGPGKILGIISVAVGTIETTGQSALLVKLATEAPEKLQVNGAAR